MSDGGRDAADGAAGPGSGTTAAKRGGGVSGWVVGFAPWIVYWILVGNVAFETAVLVALGVSVVINVVALLRHERPKVLEIGSTIAFAVFVVVALVGDGAFLSRWIQPLGNGALFLIVLVSVLVKKPFTL